MKENPFKIRELGSAEFHLELDRDPDSEDKDIREMSVVIGGIQGRMEG